MTFGEAGSITREALRTLPEPMQREGVLLLFEMGLDAHSVCDLAGWDAFDLDTLMRGTGRFVHATDWQREPA